jgi:TctA family transporter
MSMKYFTTKQKIGLGIIVLLTLLVLYLTVKLSGHKESLGILIIGLIIVDFIAMFIALILSAFKFLENKILLGFLIIVISSVIGFVMYHGSYDSYRETRSVFWGLNGERDTSNDR